MARAPRRVLTSLLVVVVACIAALGWLGYRLLQQDRALASQRVQDQLETAADRAAAAMDRRLAALQGLLAEVPGNGRLPAGTILVTVRGTSVERQGDQPLLFYPALGMPHMVSPDDRHLAVAVNEFDEIRSKAVMVVSLAGGEARTLVRDTRLPWPPSIAWAPDSQGVLYVKQPDPGDRKTELWLAPIQGGEPRKLGLAAPNMREFVVHPDGCRIAFTSGGDRSEVWVMENFFHPAK